MIGFRLEPVNAMGRNFVVAGGVFLNPCLKAEGAVAHGSHGDEPCGLKYVGRTAKGIAADVNFGFGAVDVSHVILWGGELWLPSGFAGDGGKDVIELVIGDELFGPKAKHALLLLGEAEGEADNILLEMVAGGLQDGFLDVFG
jgi:hypothetical protein